MKRSLRRAVSLLCVLAMCIGLLPSTTLAVGPRDTEQTVYVYLKVLDSDGNDITNEYETDDGAKFSVNNNGWYTIGTFTMSLPNLSGYDVDQYLKEVTSKYAEGIKAGLNNVVRYQPNIGLIDSNDLAALVDSTQYGLKIASGAVDLGASGLCWHLDLAIKINLLPKYTVSYTDGINGEAFTEVSVSGITGGQQTVGNGLTEDQKDSFKRDGYTLTGWEIEDGDGTIYQMNNEYTLSKNTNFVAQWEKDPSQGNTINVEVYVDGNQQIANSYITIENWNNRTDNFSTGTSQENEKVEDVNFTYETYNCADFVLSMKPAASTYVVQAIEANLIGGENGSDGIAKTADGTYTLDNVVGGSTVKVYLYLPYEVRYYQGNTQLTADSYKDSNTYVASEKASSGDVPQNKGAEATEITWVDRTYKTSIALAGLPAETSGWYLGSESGTQYDPSTTSSIEVSTVAEERGLDSSTGKWYIPFYARTEEVKYAAGYFVLVPDAIPEHFDPSVGYNVEIYYPNSQGDTVSYGGNDNHKVDNTTGYIGYITQAGLGEFSKNNKNGRLDLTGYTEEKIKSFLVLPEDFGKKVGDAYLDDDLGYELVPYQINSHTLGENWPNVTETDKTRDGYHVDCYIRGVQISVVYNANGGTNGTTTYYTDSGTETDPIRTGETYTVLDNTAANGMGFTRTGYTFDGWNTKANGTGTAYKVGDQISPLMTETILYAQWQKNDGETKTLSYTVEYYKDGVLADTETVTEAVWVGDTEIPVDSNKINTTNKYEGYKFTHTDPAPIPGTIVDGGVIRVYYVKEDTPDYTVTIWPADITIYTGGEVYGGVTDANGNLISESDDIEASGLPEPGYHLTLSTDVMTWLNEKTGTYGPRDLEDYLTFTYDVGGVTREWELTYVGVYDTNPTRYVYSLEPGVDENGEEIPVRLLFKDESGEVAYDDIIGMAENSVCEEYTMSINPGTLTQSEIKAKFTVDAESIMADVDIQPGTLTIRSTTNEEYVNEIVADETDVDRNAITAVADDVTYYVNDSEVEVAADRVSLLVDEVSNDAGFNWEMAQDAMDHAIDSSATDWTYRSDLSYEMAYMDLVDTQNGHAVVTADDSMTIYWPMPDDADPYGDFHVVHYTGMDRENTMDESGLDNAAKEILTGRAVRIDGRWYVAFDADSFSPFVLVYEEEDNDRPSRPRPDPDDDKDDDKDNEEPEEDVTGLNTTDHYAYIAGYEDGTVRPDGNITRAEVATIFFRLMTDEYRETCWSTSSGFTDVAAANWYNNAISTTANAGWVSGYPDGTFRPDAYITRAEFATIAARFLSDVYGGTSMFTDISGHWAEDYINRAATAGWINGYADGTFRPNAYITRAEAVTLINRMLDRAPDANHLLADMVRWPDNPETAWYYADIQEATNSHDYTRAGTGNYEVWTELLANRDWAALEEIWSQANDAPGGEVADGLTPNGN